MRRFDGATIALYASLVMSESFHGPPPSWPRFVLAVAHPCRRLAAIPAYVIAPPAKPLAAGRNSPFQFWSGSHSSNFTPVSLARLTTPSTRQNAGSVLNEGSEGVALNAPAATRSAWAIVAPEALTAVNCSHGVWAYAAASSIPSATNVRSVLPTRL